MNAAFGHMFACAGEAQTIGVYNSIASSNHHTALVPYITSQRNAHVS